MSPGYTVLGPQAVQDLHDPVRDFAHDVLVGLSERPKRMSSKYFYDDVGSRLFQRIMGLPEYYPTRSEMQILERESEAIVDALGPGPVNVVDLGAGDGAKTRVLLAALRAREVEFTYVPIDISEGAMKELVASVRQHLPGIDVAGLVAEYADGVHHIGRAAGDRTNLVLFLGSNIGNFDRVRARAFLRRLWGSLSQGDLALVGFDLKKDIEILLAAYNDPTGVTASFNLNLLTRMNRELGADFDVEGFRHFGTYNVFSGAMESYLVSLEPQVVRVDAVSQSFAFDAWEPLHTEYSYKYLRSDVEALAGDCGFRVEARYEDEPGWFIDALFRVEKGHRAPKPRD